MLLTREERAEIARRWTGENKLALEASNAWVAEHGLPLESTGSFEENN
ncbi:type II toxin-antitoxin system CcdA family antitoxin [Sphingomonas sp. GB1N7]